MGIVAGTGGDAIVVLFEAHKPKSFQPAVRLLTFPVKRPPAKQENAVVPIPYFLYSGLII